MSDNHLFSTRPTTSSSQAIPSLSSTSTSTTSKSSSFPSLKNSSISKKKPPGLRIKETRPAPSPPLDGDQGGSGSGIRAKDGALNWTSEADRLRQDIERLQLTSKSTTSLDSPSTSSPTAPTTPTHLAVSDSSSSSKGKEKDKDKTARKKKSTKDKDGQELVKDEDLEVVMDLGAGNGGTVTKVWNKKRNCVMARKLILVDAKPSIRKQILRELQIMNDCNSPYIVGYYGCFPVDVHVGIVMEFMDAGSLDHIYRHNGPVPIEMVGKVAEAVLKGLMYLYDVHRIIHRDIKPSNILANTAGEIKICDFGVSGELINSIANTFVGTSTYMSPERIQGAPYTIKSDVWSLGISLIELALGRFPFSDNPEDDEPVYDPDPTLPIASQRPKSNVNGQGNGVSLAGGGHSMSILDLLQHIVNEPAPRLVSTRRSFPEMSVSFVAGCLDKDPTTRKSPQYLLDSEWIVGSKISKDDVKAWTQGLNPTS